MSGDTLYTDTINRAKHYNDNMLAKRAEYEEAKQALAALESQKQSLESKLMSCFSSGLKKQYERLLSMLSGAKINENSLFFAYRSRVDTCRRVNVSAVNVAAFTARA